MLEVDHIHHDSLPVLPKKEVQTHHKYWNTFSHIHQALESGNTDPKLLGLDFRKFLHTMFGKKAKEYTTDLFYSNDISDSAGEKTTQLRVVVRGPDIVGIPFTLLTFHTAPYSTGPHELDKIVLYEPSITPHNQQSWVFHREGQVSGDLSEATYIAESILLKEKSIADMSKRVFLGVAAGTGIAAAAAGIGYMAGVGNQEQKPGQQTENQADAAPTIVEQKPYSREKERLNSLGLKDWIPVYIELRDFYNKYNVALFQNILSPLDYIARGDSLTQAGFTEFETDEEYIAWFRDGWAETRQAEHVQQKAQTALDDIHLKGPMQRESAMTLLREMAHLEPILAITYPPHLLFHPSEEDYMIQTRTIDTPDGPQPYQNIQVEDMSLLTSSEERLRFISGLLHESRHTIEAMRPEALTIEMVGKLKDCMPLSELTRYLKTHCGVIDQILTHWADEPEEDAHLMKNGNPLLRFDDFLQDADVASQMAYSALRLVDGSFEPTTATSDIERAIQANLKWNQMSRILIKQLLDAQYGEEPQWMEGGIPSEDAAVLIREVVRQVSHLLTDPAVADPLSSYYYSSGTELDWLSSVMNAWEYDRLRFTGSGALNPRELMTELRRLPDRVLALQKENGTVRIYADYPFVTPTISIDKGKIQLIAGISLSQSQLDGFPLPTPILIQTSDLMHIPRETVLLGMKDVRDQFIIRDGDGHKLLDVDPQLQELFTAERIFTFAGLEGNTIQLSTTIDGHPLSFTMVFDSKLEASEMEKLLTEGTILSIEQNPEHVALSSIVGDHRVLQNQSYNLTLRHFTEDLLISLEFSSDNY